MAQDLPFLKILEAQLIPWMQHHGEKRFNIARPQLSQMQLQNGVRLSPALPRGPRHAQRGFSLSGITAKWPNDGMLEAHGSFLAFTLSGEADFRCNDYVMHIPQGQAVFALSNVPRADGSPEITAQSGNHPKRYSDCIHFHEHSGSMGIWMNHQRGNRQYPALHGITMIHNSHLVSLLNNMEEEIVAQRENHLTITLHLLMSFLYTLLRDLREKKAILPGQWPIEEQLARTKRNSIQEAQQYIREHLQEHLTQEIVARRVHLSRTQFIKRFHDETGESFNQFVTRCRVEQAKHLLENTVFPVTFISELLGYKSNAHLYRVFRKYTGLLPSQYRTSLQLKNNDRYKTK